uniref:Uncharacterized protein n=1 Tax=Arundo donax TaxID=35708 RepID=A0A0A9H8U3_ARUDO
MDYFDKQQVQNTRGSGKYT